MFGISNFTGNVNALKKKIKEEKPNNLSHVDADRLQVYPKQGKNIKCLPWKKGTNQIALDDYVDTTTKF